MKRLISKQLTARLLACAGVLLLFAGLGPQDVFAQRLDDRTPRLFIGIATGTHMDSRMRHIEMNTARSCMALTNCPLEQGGRRNYFTHGLEGSYLSAAAEIRIRSLGFEVSVSRQSIPMASQFTAKRQGYSGLGTATQIVGNFGGFSGRSLTATALYVRDHNRLSLLGGVGLGYSRLAIETPLYDSNEACIPGTICNLSGMPILESSGQDVRHGAMAGHIVMGVERHMGLGFHLGIRAWYHLYRRAHETFQYEVNPNISTVELEINGMRNFVLATTLRYGFSL